MLFKHKWKILLLSVLGLGVAAAFFFSRAETYESRATLLVRYVQGYSNLDNWESQQQAGGRYGDHIIQTELEILKTWALALAVVDAVGVDQLIPDEADSSDAGNPVEEKPAEGAPNLTGGPSEGESSEGSTDVGLDSASRSNSQGLRRAQAATQILQSLQVNAGQGSNVIHLVYQNKNPEMVAVVLDELINQYFHKHAATHRPVRKEVAELESSFRAVDVALKTLRNDIRTDEGELRKISQGDTAESLAAQRTAVKSALLLARGEFAQQKTTVDLLLKRAPIQGPGGIKPAAPVVPVVPRPAPQVVQQFEESLMIERSLQLRKIALLEIYKLTHPSVQNIQGQISSESAKRDRMIAAHPGLAEAAAPRNAPNNRERFDLAEESALLAAIQTRVDIFEAQLSEIKGRFAVLSELETRIAESKSDLGAQTREWEELSANLKVARVEKKITDGSLPNISILEPPTNAAKSLDSKTKKLTLAVAFAGLGLGIGIAFLIEFVLDRRVKRPVEIEGRMRLPLMLSIPLLNGKRTAQRIGYRGEESTVASEEEFTPLLPSKGGDRARVVDLVPYAEAIRDRLVYYFALNEMNHRPKMIALAGLSERAGASTLAAGVATAFANADARVLLVDLGTGSNTSSSQLLENGNGSSHTSTSSRQGAEIGFNSAGENLFVATMTNENGKGLAGLAPRKFYDLIPKFRSSEFDYIIFDMPPVSDTSPTSAMVGFMDKVLLILDAENTDRGALKKTYADLMRGKADVSCVFNKIRSHAPRWVLS